MGREEEGDRRLEKGISRAILDGAAIGGGGAGPDGRNRHDKARSELRLCVAV